MIERSTSTPNPTNLLQGNIHSSSVEIKKKKMCPWRTVCGRRDVISLLCTVPRSTQTTVWRGGRNGIRNERKSFLKSNEVIQLVLLTRKVLLKSVFILLTGETI